MFCCSGVNQTLPVEESEPIQARVWCEAKAKAFKPLSNHPP